MEAAVVECIENGGGQDLRPRQSKNPANSPIDDDPAIDNDSVPKWDLSYRVRAPNPG